MEEEYYCSIKILCKWKEAGTFVPARMKKKNICIESISPSMFNTITYKCEKNVMNFLIIYEE